MTAVVDAPTAPAAAVASARETVAALADTLWAAARPEDLLAVTEELQALRSTLAAVEARVAVEVEATGAAKTAGWVSPADYLTHVAGGRDRRSGGRRGLHECRHAGNSTRRHRQFAEEFRLTHKERLAVGMRGQLCRDTPPTRLNN